MNAGCANIQQQQQQQLLQQQQQQHFMPQFVGQAAGSSPMASMDGAQQTAATAAAAAAAAARWPPMPYAQAAALGYYPNMYGMMGMPMMGPYQQPNQLQLQQHQQQNMALNAMALMNGETPSSYLFNQRNHLMQHQQLQLHQQQQQLQQQHMHMQMLQRLQAMPPVAYPGESARTRMVAPAQAAWDESANRWRSRPNNAVYENGDSTPRSGWSCDVKHCGMIFQTVDELGAHMRAHVDTASEGSDRPIAPRTEDGVEGKMLVDVNKTMVGMCAGFAAPTAANVMGVPVVPVGSMVAPEHDRERARGVSMQEVTPPHGGAGGVGRGLVLSHEGVMS